METNARKVVEMTRNRAESWENAAFLKIPTNTYYEANIVCRTIEDTSAHEQILLALARARSDHGQNEEVCVKYMYVWRLKRSRGIVCRAGFRVRESSEYSRWYGVYDMYGR